MCGARWDGRPMEKLRVTEIDRAEVLRYLGYKAGVHTLDAETERQIQRAEHVVLAAAQPRMVSVRFSLAGEAGLLNSTDLLAGRDIFAHLRGCYAVVLMALTLGEGVDREIRAAQAHSALYGTVADCCASVAVEQYCDLYEQSLRKQYGKEGAYMTGRFSPGYGDFPIEKQQTVQRLLDTRRKIGLGVTESCILTPRKSVTALLGIADRPVDGKPAGCDNCVLREKCIDRREGTFCAL